MLSIILPSLLVTNMNVFIQFYRFLGGWIEMAMIFKHMASRCLFLNPHLTINIGVQSKENVQLHPHIYPHTIYSRHNKLSRK